MPTYEFRCENCAHDFDAVLSFSEFDTPQVCPVCGAPAKRQISLCSFVLKGDGWTGKDSLVKAQMTRKNKKLDVKQKEQPVVKLSPNVGGERTDSWSEAAKLAKSKGKDASTHEPLVAKEKTGQ